MLKTNIFFAFKLSDVVFIMLIDVKMPIIIGILHFEHDKFMLISVEHDTFWGLGVRKGLVGVLIVR